MPALSDHICGKFCPACGQEQLDTTQASSFWKLVAENAEYGLKFIKTWAVLFVSPEKVVKHSLLEIQSNSPLLSNIFY